MSVKNVTDKDKIRQLQDAIRIISDSKERDENLLKNEICDLKGKITKLKKRNSYLERKLTCYIDEYGEL